MALFFSALISGIAQGTIYALVAIAYTIVYNATKVFNLAQGSLVALGVIMSYFAAVKWHLGQPIVFIIVMVTVCTCSLFEERIAVRPFLARRDNNLGWFVATLAFDAVLSAVLLRVYGPNEPAAVPDLVSGGFAVGSVEITYQQVLVAVVLVAVLVASDQIYRRTSAGQAMRATSEDRNAAIVLGISPQMISRLAFFWGGVASGLAAFCLAPISLADPSIGLTLSLKGFVALAIGGFGSLRGAVVGGLVLDAAGEGIFDLYGSAQYESAVGLVLLLVVLCIRPGGLLRRRVRLI